MIILGLVGFVLFRACSIMVMVVSTIDQLLLSVAHHEGVGNILRHQVFSVLKTRVIIKSVREGIKKKSHPPTATV